VSEHFGILLVARFLGDLMAGRISFRTAGSMLLLVSAATSLYGAAALAADLTITDTRTTTVKTSDGDGTGPGNVTISGAVNVTSGNAVVLDSDHAVANNGTIQNTGSTNAVGILVDLSQNRTGAVSVTGSLVVPGGTATDTTVSNNVGVLLTGPGTFTGDVNILALSGNGFIVGGDTSFGLLSRSHVVGDLFNGGTLTTIGANSYGIATTGLTTGDVLNSGTIQAIGVNSVALYVGGGVQGTVLNNGTIGSGTGPQLVPDASGTRLVTQAAVNGRAAVWIASNISGGFKNDGNGFTLAEQNADTTGTKANTTPVDALIAMIGPNAAINVAPGGVGTPQDVVVSPTTAEGFGIVNKGIITASGATGGVSALGVNIEGLSSGGTNYTARVEGFTNAGGDIQVQAEDAVATGFHIGAGGTLTTLVNTGDITIGTTDSTLNSETNVIGTKGGSAYGMVIDQGGTLNSFTNSGRFLVNVQGANSSAYGIIDRSGTLTSFTNSGVLTMSLPVGSTKTMRAVDLSANTTGVTFTNTGTITGDVLLGGGTNTFNMSNTGTIFGNVAFQAGAAQSGTNTITMNAATITGVMGLGNGNHTLNLSNNAAIRGGLTQGGTGALTLNVDQSALTVTDKQVLRINNAAFSSGSKLTFLVSGNGPGTILSGGNVSFAAGSQITVAYDGILTTTQTIAAIDAASLTFGAPLSQIAVQPTSYINVASLALDPTNSNRLLLSVHAKTATELNLGRNMTALYGAFATALNQDSAVAAAVSNQSTEAATKAAFQKLLPDTSGATLQAALNNNEMASGAIRRRLIAVAKNGIPEHTLGETAGFWAQALGDYEIQNARGEQAGYDLWGLGIALGFDIPVQDHTILGLAINESWHSANLQVNNNSPVQFYATQVDLYAHSQLGPVYIQAIGGGAFNSYEQTRRVIFDTTVSRTAESRWKGYQISGALEVGYGLFIDSYKLSPYARVAYAKLHENSYTETGGGAGINLHVGEKNPDSMRGSLGFNLDRNFPIFYDSYVEAQLRGDYTREFKTDPYAVNASFVAGGPTFTNFSNTPNKNSFGVGLGIAHKDSYSSVSLDYDARVASGFLAHQATVSVRFRF